MRLFQDVVNGFLDNLDIRFSVVFSLEIFKNPGGVLNGLFIEIEQYKVRVIAYFIPNQEILDFSGRSASKIKNFRDFIVAPRA